MVLSSLLLQAFVLGLILLLIQCVFAYLSSPLRTLPGPFLAKFSDVWRLLNHYNRQHIKTQQKLHEKYGNVVRIGPNAVSLSDVSLVKTIYSTRGTYLKSDYYSVNDALQNGHIIPNLFSTRSNEFHSSALKPIQKLYSFSSALDLEPLMDDTVRALCSELEKRFITGVNAGKTCDIADWISFFTWDFLGDMTFSKRMGFMEQGKDVGGMIETAEKVMGYFSVVGQMPILDKFLGKNPYCPIKFADFAVPAGFCIQRFAERDQNREEHKENDFMNGFLEAKNQYPELVSDNEVIGYLMLNILGGADTTAIVLKAIFYWILKNPGVKAKLVAELRSAKLAFPSAYTVVEKLPYLDACIKEGLRIHPVVGHILERIVPPSGLTLSNGTVLPPGTIVGMNPWVLHRNAEVFGPKPDAFVPERWIQKEWESDSEFEGRIRIMKDADLSFGSGNRTCLGRPLALVELYKVTATLFGKYDMDLVHLHSEWELHEQWFVWPHKIKIIMRHIEA
ncbi:cytochrome P450 [Lindgomyces ingoldianus]|uniref:Cytochrome P450 n=1 Tax=Lindgomyces ingoldianus TaxID=673940 RepID=A0ACB6QGM5_9PLEO|nr:cytochrome P450 [Lindgomyces ingoldianus]KAF2465305.1 cytochrome P450 [Lindgomyces ingoldianus]